MNLSDIDIEWLNDIFPNMLYDANMKRIVGELDFCAYYDKSSGDLEFGVFAADDGRRDSKYFFCDVFEVEIQLASEAVGVNGWPKVYEIGRKYRSIAEKQNVSFEDLHFYSSPDHACCLGIRHSYDRRVTLRSFMGDLVIPFFYRLAYVGRFGIESARNDLWEEYAHGRKGHEEHELRIIDIAERNLGRNKPCPCGSGIKYKKCCLDEVEAVESIRRRRMISDQP